jgi:putative DNA primase/helicase
MDEAQIKSITGGDRTDAYQPHGKSFNLDPQFKLWLSTNHRPTIRGGDDGIWDRLHLIPFSVRIPDADVDRYLRTKLLNESSGILNWMIQGALAWRREGLGTAVSVHRATREYRSAMDSVGAFLDEACVLDIPSVISVSDFYIAYESWAKSSGERALPKRILTNRMRDREFVIEPQGKRNVLCIHGVRLPFPSEEMTKPTPISRYAAS